MIILSISSSSVFTTLRVHLVHKDGQNTTLNSNGLSKESIMQTRHLCIIIACCASSLLAACGGNNASTPVLDQNGQPTGQVVQQQQSPGLLGMFGASLAGNMVGNMLSSNRGGGSVAGGNVATPSHTVINKTVINKTIVHAPQVAPPQVSTSPSVQPPKPTISPRSSSSFSGSRRGSFSGSSARSYGGRR